jgi:hypothetical protein
MLSAPTSLASIIASGPHHAAGTHVGGSSEVTAAKWASGSTWFFGKAGKGSGFRVHKKVPV